MSKSDPTREAELLGLQPTEVNALFLVPVAMVAWADGKADMQEIETLATRHRATGCGSDVLCVSERTRQFLYYHFVYQRPDEILIRKVLRLLEHLLEAHEPERAAKMRELLAVMCVEVAVASADGVLPLSSKISAAESRVIKRIATALKLHDSPAAAATLATIGL